MFRVHKAAAHFAIYVLCLVLVASGASAAEPSGEYFSELGPADVRVDGKALTITFPDVPEVTIRGAMGGAASFLAAGEEIPGRFALLDGGRFAFVAEGDSMFFDPGEADLDWGDVAEFESPADPDPVPAPPAPPSPHAAHEPAPVNRATAPQNSSPATAQGVSTNQTSSGEPIAPGESASDIYLGFGFTCPSGWSGTRGKGDFNLRSDKGPGKMIIAPHNMSTPEALESSLETGISAPNGGTVLTMDGKSSRRGSDGVRAILTGTFNREKVKVCNIAVISPHGGGATILAWASPEEYSDAIAAAAEKVASSLTFSTRREDPVITGWRSKLSGSRLSYLESAQNMTTGTSDGYTTGGSSSSERYMDFCSGGTFQYYESSSWNVDAGSAGVLGGSSNDSAEGSWSIHLLQGYAILELQHTDGALDQAVLAEEGSGIVYLNKEKWFLKASPVCR